MFSCTIATRQSPLALWQANFVKDLLVARHPNLKVQLLTLSTQGDKILDTPLAKIGGKGLFVKELEQALMDGRADIAVHSLKDVPMALPSGLILGAYLSRHNPTDAFVSNHYAHLDALPQGAVVGTSSLRRECQIKAHRPDLVIKSLRGNVGTRLAKLDAGEFDAIVLASSGLQRLGLDGRIRHELDPQICLPAVGQGTLAIECRDDGMREALAFLNDDDTAACVCAERAMNHALQGGCQVPIAGFATLQDGCLNLRGRVGTPDGKTLLSVSQSGLPSEALALGQSVAQALLAQGAGQILSSLY